MATERLKTIKSSGGDYTSLSAAEAGEDDLGDLVSRDEWMHFVCYPMDDTTLVLFYGFTTDSTHFIEVNGATSHGGKWNESVYRLGVDGMACINTYDSYLRVHDLQLYVTANSGNSRCLTAAMATTSNDIRLYNCILKGAGASGTYYMCGINTADNEVNYKIWNNIFYDFVNGTSLSGAMLVNGVNSSEIYNNTIVNCYIGIWTGSAGTCLAKNNLIKGTGSSYAYIGTFADGTDYNATDTTDSIGKGTHNRTSQIFTFVDADNDDYHLASDDEGALDYGVSDPGSGLFSDDIDGETRSGSWDIGADEYVSAAVKSLIARAPIHRFQHLLVR